MSSFLACSLSIDIIVKSLSRSFGDRFLWASISMRCAICRLQKCSHFRHFGDLLFIHSFIPDIYMAPFKKPTLSPATAKEKCLKKLCTFFAWASLSSTSGSRTSETGGPNFCRNFFTTFFPFFRRFPKKFQHFQKKFHLCPKISDDFLFFFSHRLFSCFNILVFGRGAKSVAHID